MLLKSIINKHVERRSLGRESPPLLNSPVGRICCRDHIPIANDGDISGEVLKIHGYDNQTENSMATVRWPSGIVKEYPVGHEGKVDIAFLEEASGGFYYRDHLPQLGINGNNMCSTINPQLGLRIVRGPRWPLDEIGYEGHVGTIVEINTTNNFIVVVQWDSGKRTTWDMTGMQLTDVYVLDNATTGVKHQHISCNACHVWPCTGFRWKCLKCFNFDLCNRCYMDDNHSLSHCFARIEIDSCKGKPVPPRKNSCKVLARGVFKGARVTECLEYISERLIELATQGNQEKVQRLLQQYPDVVNYAKNSKTSLHLASYEGHVETVKILLSFKANVDCRDHEGFTPLHYATTKYRYYIMELLLLAGANVNATNVANRTSLHIAVDNKDIEGVQCLLKYNCSVSVKDANENTPLSIAIQQNNDALIQILQNRSSTEHLISVGNASNASSNSSSFWGSRSSLLKETKNSSLRGSKSSLLEADLAVLNPEEKLRRMEELLQCSLCFERPTNVAFLCGHRTCDICGEPLETCPFCRKRITQKINLY